MQSQDVLFSSASVEWSTPQYIFDALNDEFHFTLDAAASDANAKCARYYTRDDDGLVQDWSGNVVFVNPPYGREFNTAWARKTYGEACKGVTVVGLVPARVETKWFARYYAYAQEIRFIVARVKFGRGDSGDASGAPFPSAIVIFRGKPNSVPYACVKQWIQPKR